MAERSPGLQKYYNNHSRKITEMLSCNSCCCSSNSSNWCVYIRMHRCSVAVSIDADEVCCTYHCHHTHVCLWGKWFVYVNLQLRLLRASNTVEHVTLAPSLLLDLKV